MPPRKTSRTTRKTNTRTRTGTTVRRTPSATATWSCNSPKYTPIKQECQWRIGSYRNVQSQFSGAGNKTILSPTVANKWMKYVHNGNQVYKFTNKDFCNFFGQQWANQGPRAARTYLQNKFGRYVKDVTRGKGNCWLVATTKTPTGRPFTNYNWK